MRLAVLPVAVLLSTASCAANSQDAQETRTLLPAEDRVFQGPPFPQVALRAEAQGACNITYDIAASGEPENLCGVCVADAPDADAALLANIEAAFLESAFEVVRSARRYEPADAPTANQDLQLDFVRDDLGRPGPQTPAKIACSNQTR